MNYKSMIETTIKNGGGEKVMWQSVETTEKAMEYIRDNNPAMYDCLMRELHESINGKHYDKEFAEADVAAIHYTDKEGNEHSGAYWTMEQVKDATASMTFPDDTTDYDKFVAFNAAHADFCKSFSDEDVLRIAYDFYFADEDWKGSGKIWEYMSMNV